MTVTAEQLVEAWQVNNRVNLMLLDGISDTGLNSTLSTRGGRTVAKQFAHVHDVRLGWLEVCARDLATKQTKIDKDGKITRALLKKRLKESADGVAALIELAAKNDGKVKAFRRSVVTMVAYFIAHEGHHRGNIMLTLKQTGHKVESSVQWGMWEWGKV